MLAAHGAGKLTMDGLAERPELGKGTVLRRSGTRAGIFQEQVLSGPPPPDPGAAPLDRLIAYGRARIGLRPHQLPRTLRCHPHLRTPADGSRTRPRPRRSAPPPRHRRPAGLARGMHYPTRRDPFITGYMTLADLYPLPARHCDFRRRQLTLTTPA
jgi:hypothetical protein